MTGRHMQIKDKVLTTVAAAALCVAMNCSAANAADRNPAQHRVSGTHAPSSKDITDLSAQRRAHRRSPTRIRVHPRYQPDDVYPRYNPGPNAVRDCTATYVQEFRPSGTVIVPRMHCFWRQG
jgi:hypothetical protein